MTDSIKKLQKKIRKLLDSKTLVNSMFDKNNYLVKTTWSTKPWEGGKNVMKSNASVAFLPPVQHPNTILKYKIVAYKAPAHHGMASTIIKLLCSAERISNYIAGKRLSFGTDFGKEYSNFALDRGMENHHMTSQSWFYFRHAIFSQKDRNVASICGKNVKEFRL